jgi:hypothetical protein
VVDLRMPGVCLTDRKLSDIYSSLFRWFLAGFAVMFISGCALFAGFDSVLGCGRSLWQDDVLHVVLEVNL